MTEKQAWSLEDDGGAEPCCRCVTAKIDMSEGTYVGVRENAGYRGAPASKMENKLVLKYVW